MTSPFTSPADILLASRIMAWACLLPVLKAILPIRPLVKLVWRGSRLEADAARQERVVTFARWACRLTRWKSGGNCLERALIAYRFLLEGGSAPTLVIGMGRAKQSEIVGHAWVELNGMPVGESAASVTVYVPALGLVRRRPGSVGLGRAARGFAAGKVVVKKDASTLPVLRHFGRRSLRLRHGARSKVSSSRSSSVCSKAWACCC